MRNKYSSLIIVLSILLGALVVSTISRAAPLDRSQEGLLQPSARLKSLAGGLEPGAPPTSTYSFTLQDIYNRLASGEAGAQSTFAEPASGPTAGTGHTLNEIMALAPAADEVHGAGAAEVLTGTTVWGLTSGAWGVLTGTMPDRGGVVITPTTASQAIAAGYHNGSGYVIGDADLAAGNIKAGANIFDVSGDPNVVDTSSGDAAAGDVLSGKVAWVDGSQVTGSMVNRGAVAYTPGTSNQTVAAGYHDGFGYVVGDSDLISGNVKIGVDLFGITGTLLEGGVPKTGQTTSYATGDDGDLEKGVAWPSPRFITSTTGVVTDTLTGLVWLKNANCANAARNWATALTDVASLNSAGTMNGNNCGDTSNGGSHQTDWRLPNVREMQSLIHYGYYNPALPNTAGTGQWTAGDPFTGVQFSFFWSATTDAGSTAYAWVVILGFGYVSSDNKTSSYYVWPVRGGQ
ncbi:MAG: DUF1566 domain-containing protein [Thermoflexales bacterium]|nr:DUF1566 domain-containing protein [Thermoflexales bacterium]